MKEKIEIRIKSMEYPQLDKAFQLIWKVFQEYVAPDYTEEGIKTFYEQFVIGEKFRDKFKTGAEIMYGAYVDNHLAGVLSISKGNTVSCVFVDGDYHRRGVGKTLFNYVVEKLRESGVKKIKLNASPYAVPFYHYLGFCDTGEQTSYKGIVYTPMEKVLT